MANITDFAPDVSNEYTVSPMNPRITLTSSGHLITTNLSSNDSGTYTFTSPDHGGATLVIEISVLGKS